MCDAVQMRSMVLGSMDKLLRPNFNIVHSTYVLHHTLTNDINRRFPYTACLRACQNMLTLSWGLLLEAL